MYDTETATLKMVGTNDLIVAKIVAMAVLGLGSFLIGISPIKLTKLFKMTKDSENNLLISLLLCFGGGVLLFTTFVHLQPEVREGFARLDDSIKIPVLPEGIPASELVFCLGFFFVYMIEELVHLFLDRKLHHDVLQRSLSSRCPQRDSLCIPRVSLNKDDTSISCISQSNKDLLASQHTPNSPKHDLHHGHLHLDEKMIKNSFSGLLAVLALSFHAVFEGLAVGLENSVQKVWYLFGAIATHKFVIAFCVGVELVTSQTKSALVLVYIGTFAVVTPLGIGMGIALSEAETAELDVTSVFLQGMAAGTLLYVVFFEVLARERSNRHSGVWQLIAIMAGFAVMFSLQYATGHEHGHSHGHDEAAAQKPTTTAHDHSHFS